uniref:Uncharacterized protein n=1 Tax=Desertifilum tharense IPPAS B-1220 TaxID=1781255 RepID=A0ACD5H0N9_9CYAN
MRIDEGLNADAVVLRILDEFQPGLGGENRRGNGDVTASAIFNIELLTEAVAGKDGIDGFGLAD